MKHGTADYTLALDALGTLKTSLHDFEVHQAEQTERTLGQVEARLNSIKVQTMQVIATPLADNCGRRRLHLMLPFPVLVAAYRRSKHSSNLSSHLRISCMRRFASSQGMCLKASSGGGLFSRYLDTAVDSLRSGLHRMLRLTEPESDYPEVARAIHWLLAAAAALREVVVVHLLSWIPRASGWNTRESPSNSTTSSPAS